MPPLSPPIAHSLSPPIAHLQEVLSHAHECVDGTQETLAQRAAGNGAALQSGKGSPGKPRGRRQRQRPAHTSAMERPDLATTSGHASCSMATEMASMAPPSTPATPASSEADRGASKTDGLGLESWPVPMGRTVSTDANSRSAVCACSAGHGSDGGVQRRLEIRGYSAG